MASLKEIKRRISSIRSIWKITSAMRMIASAKLHRTQGAVAHALPYEKRLREILSTLLRADEVIISPYAEERAEVKRVAIVVFSSNSSLCGAFNSNILKKLHSTIKARYRDLSPQDILVFPVGRKVHDAVLREGYTPQGDFHKVIDKPGFADAQTLSHRLMELFCTHQVDRVELVYTHFKNMSVQTPTVELYLPILPIEKAQAGGAHKLSATPEYILEPSRDELVASLLPKVLELKIFTVLLDSVVAEHAARTVAMQLATENAQGLIDDLVLLYNKSRQQAITNELLDIAGGRQ